MQIRAAKYADINAISELIIPLVEHAIVPTCSEQGARLLLASMNSASIERYFAEGYQYYIAQLSAEIIGVIAIVDNSHLYHLFVAQQHQGNGCARALWLHAKEQCLKAGNNGHFTVNCALSAVPVYRRWGFVALAGIRERHGVKDVPMSLNSDRIKSA